MSIIQLTAENLSAEHICCAISEKKGETCVADKKAWLAARFADGLVFRKLDTRGKVFIEYIPAERAWCPLDAPDYLHINCLWVSGQFKGRGYARQLLDACVADARAQGKSGVTIISAKKKMPFLSDGKFMRHMGFALADTAANGFELLYLPLDASAPAPRLLPHARAMRTDAPGLVLYYSDQCPFAHTYAQRVQTIAQTRGVQMMLRRLTSADEARQAPSPVTTYALFDGGAFITNEILSEIKFAKYLEGR